MKEKLSQEYDHDMKMKMEILENKFKEQLESQQKESDAILKECQTISEYNIIQSEIEKSKTKSDLEDANKQLTDIQSKYEQSLQNYAELNKKFINVESNLGKMILELDENKQKLMEELNLREKALEEMSKEKSLYEITFKTYQTTINVLTKRLTNSDQDVEQLKKELSKCEEKNLEYESKYLQLVSELKQAQISKEELETQFELAVKLNRTEIEQIREDLCQKVQQYKEQVEKYSKRIGIEETQKKEIMEQLHEAFETIQKVKMEMEHLQCVNTQYEFEICRAQNELEGCNLREMDWSIRTESYENTVRQIEDELRMKHDEFKCLKLEIANLKNTRVTDIQSNQPLDDEEQNIYSKYIQISGRYDEILQRFENLQEKMAEKDKIINDLSNIVQEFSNREARSEKQGPKINSKKMQLKKHEKVSDVYVLV